MNDSYIYTPAMLAEEFGISTGTLRRWRMHPKFPAPFQMGWPRWRLSDVRQWQERYAGGAA